MMAIKVRNFKLLLKALFKMLQLFCCLHTKALLATVNRKELDIIAKFEVPSFTTECKVDARMDWTNRSWMMRYLTIFSLVLGYALTIDLQIWDQLAYVVMGPHKDFDNTALMV